MVLYFLLTNLTKKTKALSFFFCEALFTIAIALVVLASDLTALKVFLANEAQQFVLLIAWLASKHANLVGQEFLPDDILLALYTAHVFGRLEAAQISKFKLTRASHAVVWSLLLHTFMAQKEVLFLVELELLILGMDE